MAFEFKNYTFVEDAEIEAGLEGATMGRLEYLKWLHQSNFDNYQRSPFYQKASVEKHRAHLDMF